KDTELNNGGNITVEASGDYTIDADGVEVRETLSTNETKKQTNNQPKEDKYAKGKALEELNNLVGLNEVKESVRKFINLARINKKKKSKVYLLDSLHFIQSISVILGLGRRQLHG